MKWALSARPVSGAILLALVLLGNVCVARAQAAAEQPLVRAGEDPEVSRLHLEALKTEDPDEREKIYLQILEKDPSNVEARHGLREAKVGVAQKRAAEAEKAKVVEKQRTDQFRGRAALRAAETALLAGNITGARQKLNEAKSLGQAGPDVLRIERAIGNAEWESKLKRFAGLGAVGAVLLGVLVWIISLFRKGEPYVEVLTGAARGQRFPVDKDVLTIGALAQKGEEKNDVVVSDPQKTISRFHCEVHRKGKSFYVVDCKSANGTRLDGRPIPAGRLIPIKSGARIQLGATCTLKFGFERRKR